MPYDQRGKPRAGIATTIYLTPDLYQWLKSRMIHEVDEHGRQLSMTRVIARYCAQARQRIDGTETAPPPQKDAQ
jgi:hypothetical protein